MLGGFQDLIATDNVKHAQEHVRTPRRNALAVGGVTHRISNFSCLKPGPAWACLHKIKINLIN